MSNIENKSNKEAVDKLRSLVNDIVVCLFCTDLKTDDGSTCRPMSAIKVCDQGNIWFFSEKNSDKNKAIAADNDVQLFFSHPGKGSYMVINGEAEIILDKVTIEELWTPIAKIWFKEGKNDPNISVIKVTPKNSYYWDTDGNRMINFLQLVVSVATGTNLVTSNSPSLLEWNQMLCLNSSPKATIDCIRSFSETDFRDDLKKIKIPVLIIHGDADDIVPIMLSGNKTAELIPKAKYIVYKDAPHGLFITEKEKLNADLIEFITQSEKGRTIQSNHEIGQLTS